MITLYYAPRSRSFTALWLLEELGVDYDFESFDLSSGRHKEPDFLEINPMGKVPVVVDHGVPISELGAIAIYMSDKYREIQLSPGLDSELRPEFLKWMFFSSAIMEPAFGEMIFKWDVPASSVAWGSFAQMKDVLLGGLEKGPWLLGDTFSAADVLVGSSMRFGQMFGILPKDGPMGDYLERLVARPACERAAEIERTQGERFPLPQN